MRSDMMKNYINFFFRSPGNFAFAHKTLMFSHNFFAFHCETSHSLANLLHSLKCEQMQSFSGGTKSKCKFFFQVNPKVFVSKPFHIFSHHYFPLQTLQDFGPERQDLNSYGHYKEHCSFLFIFLCEIYFLLFFSFLAFFCHHFILQFYIIIINILCVNVFKYDFTFCYQQQVNDYILQLFSPFVCFSLFCSFLLSATCLFLHSNTWF